MGTYKRSIAKSIIVSLGLLALLSTTTLAQIGKGWLDITELEEARYDIQLENFKKPSGDNTQYDWPNKAPAWVDKDGRKLDSLSDLATTMYEWNAATKTHRFTLIKFPGNRSEIRVRDVYKNGSRQFEGYLTMNNKLDKQAVFQLFGSASGATQMQIRGFGKLDNGRLEVVFDTSMAHRGNRIIATNINDKEIRLNVIHLQEDVGNVVLIYVNGQEKFRFADNESKKNGHVLYNYMKYGIYGREQDGEFDGLTNMQTQWRNVRFWRDGRP
jgi:hypothetical protein